VRPVPTRKSLNAVAVPNVGSHILSLWLGITGIWLAYIADEWVRGFLVWRRWRTGGWWSSARASARQVRHR
jgi:Na+-driven multidrug efflux pump